MSKTGIERQFCSGLQQVGCLCVQGEIPQRQRLLKDGDAWNQMKVFQAIINKATYRQPHPHTHNAQPHTSAHTSTHTQSAAHHRAHTHTHAHTHPPTHRGAPTHTHTHTHTHIVSQWCG